MGKLRRASTPSSTSTIETTMAVTGLRIKTSDIIQERIEYWKPMEWL
jgi:hypothetical protein